MNDPLPLSGPYTHAKASINRTMGLVMVALLPATILGFYMYGWPAIFLFLITILTAIFAEALSLKVAGKPTRPFLMDGSALLTGWLLAMTLPPQTWAT